MEPPHQDPNLRLIEVSDQLVADAVARAMYPEYDVRSIRFLDPSGQLLDLGKIHVRAIVYEERAAAVQIPTPQPYRLKYVVAMLISAVAVGHLIWHLLN